MCECVWTCPSSSSSGVTILQEVTCLSVCVHWIKGLGSWPSAEFPCHRKLYSGQFNSDEHSLKREHLFSATTGNQARTWMTDSVKN